MKAETLADRVRSLIDRVHGRSVNKAAEAIGIPQRTLARIVDQKAPMSPRMDHVQQIAAGYGASVEWLVTGKGDGPELTAEPARAIGATGPVALEGPVGELTREMLRRNLVLSRLGIAGDGDRGAHALMSATERAAKALGRAPAPGEAVPIDARFAEAMALEIRAWLKWIEVATDVYGVDSVREMMERHGREIPKQPGRVPTTAFADAPRRRK